MPCWVFFLTKTRRQHSKGCSRRFHESDECSPSLSNTAWLVLIPFLGTRQEDGHDFRWNTHGTALFFHTVFFVLVQALHAVSTIAVFVRGTTGGRRVPIFVRIQKVFQIQDGLSPFRWSFDALLSPKGLEISLLFASSTIAFLVIIEPKTFNPNVSFHHKGIHRTARRNG